MDASFFQAPVQIPKLSGFDKSFQNLYTAPCGTLVPALCDELMAGSVVDLDMAASVSLPPLASDTFMRCSLKVEASSFHFGFVMVVSNIGLFRMNMRF